VALGIESVQERPDLRYIYGIINQNRWHFHLLFSNYYLLFLRISTKSDGSAEQKSGI